jgi:phospholipid/cholesterol/gamma-HCH transport system substrate-binding protein
METKANFVLIGAFTLAVIGAAFGFVFWFQSLGAAAQRVPLRIVFEGAASGLRTGGNVNFNGIKIGEVTSIKLDDPKRVVVITAVDKSAPIRKDSLVGLEFAGLTGVSSISLKGGSVEAGGVPVGDDGVPTLVADPNAIQDIGEAVRGMLQNVNRLVSDNQDALKSSIGNLEAFSKSLAANSARIDSIMIGVDNLMGNKDGKEGELQLAAKSFRELAENLDKRTAVLLSDGRVLIGDSRRTLADISRAVNNFDRNPTRVLFGASARDAAPPQPPQNPRDARARQR